MLMNFPEAGERLRTPAHGDRYQELVVSQAANAARWIAVNRRNHQELTKFRVEVPERWAGELIMKQIGSTAQEFDALNNKRPASYDHAASVERTAEFNGSDPRDPELAQFPEGIRLVFNHAGAVQKPSALHDRTHLHVVPANLPGHPDSAA